MTHIIRSMRTRSGVYKSYRRSEFTQFGCCVSVSSHCEALCVAHAVDAIRVLRRGPGEVLDIIYQGELAAWAPASAALPASFSAHFLHAFCTAALRCASGEWSWSDQLADLSTEVALRPQAAAAVPGTPVPRHACLDVQKTVLTWPCASILLMLTDGLHAASQAPTCVSAMHELAGGRS